MVALILLFLSLLISCSKEDDLDGNDMDMPDAAIDTDIDSKADEDRCSGQELNLKQRKISRGVIEGIDQNGILSFLSIPYAKAPMGELRWKAPQEDQSCFTEMYQANQMPTMCPQLNDQSQVVGQEDCLKLNIWTKTTKPKEPLPVLVFIHGGGNQQGSASVSKQGRFLYDGSRLVHDKDVIVVVIQYRLGVLGWLSLDQEIKGNYGLLDQILALQWIKKEISAFGGDPNRITIFGQSAGARDVCALWLSPLAQNLFQSAIMQSGACYFPSKNEVIQESTSFLDQSSCKQKQGQERNRCLYDLSVAEIFKAKKPEVNVVGQSDQLQPYVDGITLVDDPIHLIESAKVNAKTLIVGANKNETSMYLPRVNDEEDLKNAVQAQYGVLTDEILDVYGDLSLTPQQKLEQITSDSKYVCQARRIAQSALHTSTKVYLYSFGQYLSKQTQIKAYQSFHGMELPFLFYTLNRLIATEQEIETSQQIAQYWVNLASGQGVNHEVDLIWPVYSDRDEWMSFETDGQEIIKGYKKKECDFWDEAYLSF